MMVMKPYPQMLSSIARESSSNTQQIFNTLHKRIRCSSKTDSPEWMPVLRRICQYDRAITVSFTRKDKYPKMIECKGIYLLFDVLFFDWSQI